MDHGGGRCALPNRGCPRTVARIGWAVVVATVVACNSPSLDTSSNAVSAAPDAAPIDIEVGELAPPTDPFGIADLKTSDLDAEIGALKDGRSFHDLEPNERARFRALAKRRSSRRSHAPVENRTPGPNVYPGDSAASDEKVLP